MTRGEAPQRSGELPADQALEFMAAGKSQVGLHDRTSRRGAEATLLQYESASDKMLTAT